jgi:uncharacterized phage-like protein YoqJ
MMMALYIYIKGDDMKIAISGHGPDSFLVSHYSPESIIRIASDIVCIFQREFGDELLFNLGGAIGTDQWVGKACIEQNIKYHIFLPFQPEVQAKYWNSNQRKELDKQLKYASGINISDLSGNYDPHLYQERNKKMIDAANILVAFWVGKRKGGTYNAMRYALSQSKFVFNALNELRPIFSEDLKTGWSPPTVIGE